MSHRYRRLLALALLVPLTLAGCDQGGRRSAMITTSPDVAEQIRGKINVGGGGSGPQETVEATGFATIRGSFKVIGSPPQMASLNVTGDDAELCAPGGRAPLSQEVVVGSGGELANVLIFLDMKIPDSWEHESYAPMRDATLKGADGFDQKGCVFLSHVFAMRSTQTVEIINSDPTGHNTNIQPVKGAAPSNNSLPANSSAMYAPGGESPLPFPVTCSIHPWMKAYMITRDNPYFAVSTSDGAFELKNVPAGVPLTFRVWQERAGFLQEVTVNGAAEKWSKGRYKTTLNPDEDVTLDVTVNADVFN